MKIKTSQLRIAIKIHQYIWVFSVLFCLCNLIISNPLQSNFIATLIELINIDILQNISGGEPSDITNFVNF